MKPGCIENGTAAWFRHGREGISGLQRKVCGVGEHLEVMGKVNVSYGYDLEVMVMTLKLWDDLEVMS